MLFVNVCLGSFILDRFCSSLVNCTCRASFNKTPFMVWLLRGWHNNYLSLFILIYHYLYCILQSIFISISLNGKPKVSSAKERKELRKLAHNNFLFAKSYFVKSLITLFYNIYIIFSIFPKYNQGFLNTVYLIFTTLSCR